ncbi:MAG: MBL fold metallo-hydrolase [Promethearchaeota archaeon]
MKVTFIGTAGSFLTANRSYPSILLNDDLLLDCGEGTTQNLLKINSINNIKIICITHLHHDHYLGLFSLLWYYWLNNRKEDLEIIGPPKTRYTVEKILKLINTSEDIKTFNLVIIELKDSNEIQTFKKIYTIKSISVDHNIISFAFRIEKEDKSICYSGDTRPTPNLKTLSKNSDLLIAESSFPNKYKELAHKIYHSTPSDAAELGINSNCKKLVLFHISSAFKNQFARFKAEAEEIFKNDVIIAKDLMILEI